jgi:hypothetical protein
MRQAGLDVKQLLLVIRPALIRPETAQQAPLCCQFRAKTSKGGSGLNATDGHRHSVSAAR